MRYIFHVVSLAHTQTTSKYLACAYTQKVIKFCGMMKSLGHIVFLYGSKENEARCDQFISCIPKLYEPDEYVNAPFDPNANHWKQMNKKVISHMAKRIQPKDFICLIAGLCQKDIADHFHENISVEFGVGYEGVFSPYKVFESYAWMHTVYGHQMGPSNANGNFFDVVIPNYFDVEDFPFSEDKEDYYLFIGRLIGRKGVNIAAEVCERLGKRLIIAGHGEPPEYGEYVGVVNKEQRGKLMSKARAVFVPTLYLEPFGGVAIESNLCGTPVITTDWGAFSETVTQGENGYRCRTLKEFMNAIGFIENKKIADAKSIREFAINRYSTEKIKWKYQSYFDQLYTLWEEGWYQL